MNVKILVDNRERAVIPFVEEIHGGAGKAAPISIETRQLEVGDYLILDNDAVLACVERKTLKDFAASFGGRYASQKKKMFDFRDKTGCKLFYMVEGVAFPTLDKKFNHIPYRNILAAITTMMVRDSVFVVQTKDQKHSAERLYDIALIYIAKVVNEIKGQKITGKADSASADSSAASGVDPGVSGGTAEAASVGSTEAAPVGSTPDAADAVNPDWDDPDDGADTIVGFSEFKSEGKSTDDRIIEMWSCLSGISAVGGAAVGSVCSVREFFGDMYEAALETQTNKKRSLTKMAKASLEKLKKMDPETSKKFLASCPGVGKQTAGALLAGRNIRDLIMYTVPELAECRMSAVQAGPGAEPAKAGKRLGEKRAGKLDAVFSARVSAAAVENVCPGVINRKKASRVRHYDRRNQYFRGKTG